MYSFPIKKNGINKSFWILKACFIFNFMNITTLITFCHKYILSEHRERRPSSRIRSKQQSYTYIYIYIFIYLYIFLFFFLNIYIDNYVYIFSYFTFFPFFFFFFFFFLIFLYDRDHPIWTWSGPSLPHTYMISISFFENHI